MAAALARGRSLEEAGREQGLTVQKSAPLARGERRPPLASPQLCARAFELKAGEIAQEPFAVGRRLRRSSRSSRSSRRACRS